MILKKMKIQNFKNIKELKIDFSSNSAGSKNDLQKGYFQEIGKGKILPQVNAIIGPNAIGKTNILSALSFLDYMTSKQVNKNAIKKLLISKIKDKTNIDSDELNDKVKVFLNNLENNKINDEELDSFLDEKNKITKKNYMKNANSHELPIKICATFWDIKSKDEMSVGMKLSKTGLKTWIPENDFFKSKWTFIFDGGEFSLSNILSNANELYDPMLNKMVRQIGIEKLKKIINLADSTISEVFKKENKIFFRKTNSDIDIDFSNFSSGTKRILYIYSFLLYALKDAKGVFFIDEIELFLHRELSIAIIDTMNMISSNDKDVSFVFSTHNPLILGENIKFKQVHEIKEDSQTGIHSSTKLSTLFKGHENIEAKYKKGIISKYPASSVVFDTIYEVINE